MARIPRLATGAALLALAAVTAGAASAQTPDITGRWVLNKQRSILPSGGRSRAPIALELRIETKDGKYTIKRTDEGSRGARIRYEETFTTDGEPIENETKQATITVKARWQGNSLVVERSRRMTGSSGRGRRGGGRMGGGGISYTATYTLSEDGRLMIVFIDFGQAPIDPITLAYEKK